MFPVFFLHETLLKYEGRISFQYFIVLTWIRAKSSQFKLNVYSDSPPCRGLLWWPAWSPPCCSEELGCGAPSVWMCTPQAAGSPEHPGADPPWWKCPGWRSTNLEDAPLTADAPTGDGTGKRNKDWKSQKQETECKELLRKAESSINVLYYLQRMMWWWYVAIMFFFNHNLHFHLQCLWWSLRWRVRQSLLLYKYMYTGIIINHFTHCGNPLWDPGPERLYYFMSSLFQFNPKYGHLINSMLPSRAHWHTILKKVHFHLKYVFLLEPFARSL